MKKKISLKWKIARYLLIFAAGLIGLLVLFQLVLLEPMYERYKVRTVREAADLIVSSLKSNDPEEIMNTIYSVSARNDTCIRILNNGTDYGAGSMGCSLYRMSSSEILKQADQARKNGNEYVSVNTQNYHMPDEEDSNEFQSIIDTRLVDLDSSTAIVMIYAGITPINATTETLRTQILYIALIVLAAMILLTYLMNRNIARPLTKINQSAKTLAQGVYQSDPSTNQYLEASELNETLTDAAQDIQKADKAKRDLIANVSHDLRTPLTMISGYGEMMRDLPGEKTDENIQVIIDESKRLTYLVNDLLDLSKFGEKKIVLNRTDFSITDVIERNLKKYEVYSLEDGFVFEKQLEPDLYVNGDEARIEQVFNNFITNAINYSGSSRKIIIRAQKKDQHARIEVQDFGEGISQNQIKDIWDRYYKIDKKHVRSTNSSGIGLAICRQVLELHGAPYGVLSKLNEGSTFWFELPLVEHPTQAESREVLQ